LKGNIREKTLQKTFPDCCFSLGIYVSLLMGCCLMKKRILLIIIAFFLPWQALVLGAEMPKQDVRIGILAKAGKEICMKRWEATGDYLNEKLPEYSFHIIPLSFDEVIKAAREKSVDFYLINPAFYIYLEYMFNARRLATMTALVNQAPCAKFGGVIFTRRDRSDIRSLESLRGKTFMAVDERSFGGWYVAKRTFFAEGIRPLRDFKDVSFGKTHSGVVMAVLNGEVDAGTVRTGTLEYLARMKKISMDDFYIINEVSNKDNCPFTASTELYPEWPMAKAEHTDLVLAKKVTIALLELSPEMKAAAEGHIYGWNVPDNYQLVHNCLKEIKAAPYEHWVERSIDTVFKRVRIWLIILLSVVAVAISISSFQLTKVLHQQYRSEKSGSSFYRRLFLLSIFLLSLTVAGSAIASGLSVLQKVYLGYPFSFNTFIVPILIGGAIGLMVGGFFYRSLIQMERVNFHIRLLQMKSKQFLELFDMLPSGAQLVDYKGSIVMCSNKSLQLLKYEQHQLEGTTMVSLVHPEERDYFEFSFKEKALSASWQIETRLVRKDGQVLNVILSGNPIEYKEGDLPGVLLVNTDITQRKSAEREKERIQEQLNHTQKMNSIGLLAGGIAHDFNNMLGGIVSAVQLLKSPKFYIDEKQQQYLEMILTSADRATNLIAKLLTFSRKGAALQQPVDVHSIIKDIESILIRTISKRIRINVGLHAVEFIVISNITELQNTLMNLAVNASQAMPQGGDLDIETNNIFIQKGEKAAGIDIKPGEYISIKVRDTGMGIPQENMSQIFDPFFTTKEVGEGTGLGLSAVYGTVVKYKGKITVQSEVDKGSEFVILLPCCSDCSPESVKEEHGVTRGTGTILLVDDEEVIRISVEHLLTDLGYHVITASNGFQAVDIYQEKFHDIDLIITDIQMPGMGGGEAFFRFREINPQSKVIVTTGYASWEGIEELVKNGLAGILYKPFKDYEISNLLAKILVIQ
jgi:PAS domain S-box-containing protein